MTAAERIGEARKRLEQARGALDKLSDRDILDALARVVELWRDGTSTFRRDLAAQLPGAAGFSRETVEAGLAAGFEPWTASAFVQLVEAELGVLCGNARREESGHALTSVVLAGSIPMPSLLSIVLPLVLRSPVMCKPASRDLVTATLVADSIRAVEPLLADCVAIVPFEKQDEAAARLFFDSPCVVVTGASETIADVEARLEADQARLFYGHRISVGVVDLASIDDTALEATTRKLAIDVALWDQLGCLSPTQFYLVGASPTRIDAFADALALALEAAEHRWPRGPIAVDAAAAIVRERSEASMRGALGQATRVLGSEGTQWTVIREHDATLRPAPLHRFVRLLPVSDIRELARAITPVGDVLAGVVVAGFGQARGEVAQRLLRLGASRVCAPGQLQAPPIDWPRDNQPLLRDMIAGDRNRDA